MANRLALETSPYLLQHAHNPVDWYPWGQEAFAASRAANKPILLSVGYSACHWCHVMERESFEDAAIAALMNAHFINIKVDREERPDVDAIYMAAMQALTGQGGWPMTMFLTPDGKPFYGGTYYPPVDLPQLPGFPRVLVGVAEAYRERPAEVAKTGRALVARIAELTHQTPRPAAMSPDTLDAALVDLGKRFDPRHGGFGQAPKFPPAMVLELLLRLHRRPEALAMAEHTLEMMARGGVYDQLGGGFHRYAVDETWLVPHFEKMLYDNAQLARVYLLAFQLTRRVLYEVVATETLNYVVREMTDPDGGFYATQDADSEGVEGKFFVWTLAEVQQLLGDEDGRLFAAVFDVTAAGNFEHANILHLAQPLADVAKREGVGLERLAEVVARGRDVLFAAREKRIKPARDEKVIAAWNGMMLVAFAEAARILDRPDYLAIAERNADFLLTRLRREGGRLCRTYKDGKARLNAYLEDYAHVIDGLLVLYEASFTARWLESALELARVMLDEFWDAPAGLLYDTGKSHEELVVRPRDAFDNATPSGNAVAADVLGRLARLTGEPLFAEVARAVLATAGELMARYPLGMGRMLCALDRHMAKGHELVLVGAMTAPAMQAFRRDVAYRYRPYLLLAGGDGTATSRLAPRVPLLTGKTMGDGQPTAYLCHGQTCLPATHLPAELLRQLAEGEATP